MRSWPSGGQRHAATGQLDTAPLALGQAAPDAEALVVVEGVLEALHPHRAADADPLGLAGGAALLGEERLGVGLRAERLLPPRLVARRVLALDDRRRGDGLVPVRRVRVLAVPLVGVRIGVRVGVR